MGNNPKPEKIDWKWLVTTSIGALVLMGGTTWAIAGEFAKLDKHIGRVETAVRIVGAKEGGDTKTLIDEALTVAKNASDDGRAESAKRVLDIANRLVAEQATSGEAAPPEFFEKTVQKYQKLKQSPELSDAIWEGTTSLANYRSAITEVPAGFNYVSIGVMGQKNGFRYLKNSLFSGRNAVKSPGCDGFDLDGWYLDNVVFEGVTICYRGSPAILSNVHFVNCRFDVAKSPKAGLLLEAVIKQSANAALG
jgi:hypothetical protein